MAASSNSLHESPDTLPSLTKDMHRALVSLQEELEAADWYQQRVDAAEDEELKRVLAHNRDEEKEHASMVLEWIRRRDPVFAAHLRNYLFKEGDIVAIEETIENAESEPAGVGAGAITSVPALTIGSLIAGLGQRKEGP